MKTLIDAYELRFQESAPRTPRASIDLEIDWDEREVETAPGVPSETWLRARGWSSDDV